MKRIVSVICLLTLLVSLTACGNTDPSNCPFAGYTWERDTGGDGEFIRFGKDGSFSYYCGCGEPIDNSDLCETYVYNSALKTIMLKYPFYLFLETWFVKVEECTDTTLVLNFSGDIREFTKMKY